VSANTPEWKEKPDCEGLWVFRHVEGHFKGYTAVADFADIDTENTRACLRWFGPIPPVTPEVLT